MESVDGSRSVLHSSDQTVLYVHCDPCKYTEVHKEASHFCNDCLENLCKACAESHKRLKLLRNHTLVPIDASKHLPSPLVSNPIICDCDQTKVVTDFCETHNDVICNSCRTIKHRKCSTCPMDSKKAADEVLKEIIRKVDELENEINEALKSKNKDLESLSVAKGDCINAIESFIEQLNQFIETLKLGALKNVNECESEQKHEIKNQIASLTETQRVLAKDKTVLQLALKSGNRGVMFAAEIKLSKHLEDYQTLLHDISRDVIHPKLEFEKNKSVIDFQETVSALGTVNTRSTLFPALGMQSCSEIDIILPWENSNPYITGCVITPDGDILICDRRNSNVKHFSSEFIFLGSIQLQGPTWDACMIDTTTLIVCLPDNKQLQNVEITPLKKGTALSVGVECYGIDVVGNEIFVSCPHEDGIRVLDMQGQAKRRIQFGLAWDSFGYLKVKPNLHKVYITDNKRNMLICLRTDGTTVFEYADEDLKAPRGLCVDDEGNAIVCGFNSNNVHVVNAKGEKVNSLRSANDGLNSPQCLAFISKSGTLIIGSCNGKQLLALTLA